jgi:PAS domain S-box-containing protein
MSGISPDRVNGQRVRYLLVILFVIMTVAILVTSYVYYQNYEEHYKLEIDHQLTAISDLKVNELVNWRTERLSDAGTFFHNPLFSSRVRHLFNDTNDAETRGEVRAWLEKELAPNQYDRVYLMDTTGTLRMSVPDTQNPVAATVSRELPRILASGNITVLDFYRDDSDQKIYLTIVVPLYDEQEGGQPQGFLAFQVDPGSYLYPFINEWPGPSASAETLILRQEGNEAVYLNGVKFSNNPPLTLRIPLDRTEVPAVKAALGGEGIVEGADYRGVPVIAAIRKVPGTPWFLVARMDTSEVYGPLREQIILLMGIVATLLVGIGAVIGVVWRGESTRFYRDMYESERELRNEREKARSYLEIVGATVLAIGADQAVIMVNPAGCRLLGRCEDEILGKNWFDTFLPERLREASRELFARKVTGAVDQPEQVENIIVTAGGEERLVAWHSTLIRDENQVITGTLRSGEDITDRTRAEEEIRLLARMADDAPASLIVHDFDGNMLYANEETLRLHGFTREEFLEIHLRDLDVPETEKLIDERMQDLHNLGMADFDVYHYRKDGSTFPLHVNAKIINWGGREVLLSIATDLTERKQIEEKLERQNEELQAANEELVATEEELKAQYDELSAIQRDLWKSEERFSLALDATNDGIWDWNVPTGSAFFSPHWYTMLGYEPNEMPGSYATWRSLVHPDDLPATEGMIQASISGKEGYSIELRMLTKQGDWKWVLTRGMVVDRDAKGDPVRMVGTHTDITERKRIEDTLLRVNQKLNVLSQLTRKDLTSQIFILNGYLELAKKQAAGQDPVIESIMKGEQAARSINEITEFTRDYQDMGIKPPVWQNVKLAFLFGLSHISIGEISHSIETGDLGVFADPLLEKACQGLFENSLAHGGHVTRIRIWHTFTPAGATIFYEDDGTGIPQEIKEKIFLRGDGVRASVRGLFFVREILDITNITIRETGQPGKGARFEISVPNGAYR